jgi:cystathionine beta-lyase
MFDFDQVIARRDTESAKWGKYPADVLPMWVADMDFAVAPSITDALCRRLEQPVFGYGAATNELRDVIVARMHSLYQWTISPDDIVFLPGIEPGVNMALKALLAPQDAVMVQLPVYRPLLKAPVHWGMRRIDLGFIAEGEGYRIDFDAFRCAANRAKAFLLCNPHNPLGKVFSPTELTQMAEACLSSDTIVISDEIHCDVLFDGWRHYPIASLDRAIADRSVTLMAASKTFNIAGLKTAFAIIPNPEIRALVGDARMGMVDSVNILGLTATQAAFATAEDWAREMRTYLQANRDYLSDAVTSRLKGVSMKKPEGTFLAWLDCSALPLDGAPEAYFLEYGKVALSAGTEFGPMGENHVRLNFGCPRAILEDGIQRLEKSLKHL